MEEKLANIFNFLSKNRKYNKELQSRYYRNMIVPYGSTAEKYWLYYYDIANTQSQPKLINFQRSSKN